MTAHRSTCNVRTLQQRSFVTPSRFIAARGAGNQAWRIVMMSVLCVLATLLVAGRATAGVELRKSFRDPAFVDIRIDRPAEWLVPKSRQRDALIGEVAGRVHALHEQHPDRLIVLRYVDMPLHYEQLPVSKRQDIVGAAGRTADVSAWYEQALADLTMDILTRSRSGRKPMMLSVYGLPLELDGKDGGQAAARINKHFSHVLADLQGFVVPTRFILSRNSSNHAMMLERGLAEAYRIADGRPVYFHSNREWKMSIGLRGPLRGPTSATARSLAAQSMRDSNRNAPIGSQSSNDAQGPMLALIGSWGQSNSPWDLNSDGIVDVDDLLIMIANWSYYANGGTGLPGSGGGSNNEPEPMGRFVNPPLEYVIGSGVDLQFELLSGAPQNANVVFQTWSDTAEAVQGAHADYGAPFTYPASKLDLVTPGGAELQALIRNGNNQVVEIIRVSTAFVLPNNPPGGGGGGGGGGNGSGGNGGNGDSGGDAGNGGSGDSSDSGNSGGNNGGSNDGNNGGDTGGNPNAPLPTPVITIMSTSGMAPFAVHVNGLSSTLGIGDLLTARFEWDFGDPNGQFNKLVGWNAAHIYDQPGTYTITLKLTNQAGGQAVATKQVTVTAPNRTTIYVATNGNDSNPGTSENAPIRTAARAAQLVNDNTRILFRRAGTYDISSTFHINKQNVVIGAYGNGAKPVLHWTVNSNYAAIMSMGSQAKNVVVQDLTFDSPFTPNNLIVRGIHPNGSNVTVRNCHFDDVSYAMNTEQGVDGFLVLNNTADAIGAYLVWAQGHDHTYLGNTVANSMHEHNIRIGGAKRLLIAHNDLTNTNKSTIWGMLTEHCYITGNVLREGRFLAGPNFAVGSPSERSRWIVFEGNEIINEGLIIYAGAENVMIRNNVVRNNGGEAFSIWGYHSAMNRTTRNVTVVNNTAINNSSSYGRFIKFGKGAENLTVANNLYVAPSFNTSMGGGNVVTDENQLAAGQRFHNNYWANPYSGSKHHFLGGNGLTPSQWEALTQCQNEKYRSFTTSDLSATFEPQFNANTGVAVPGVHVDFYGKPRSLAGAVTVGAVHKP